MTIELVRFVPKDYKLHDQFMNPIIFKGIIVGSDGGYAFNEYVEYVNETDRERSFVNILIADSTFKLTEIYNALMDKKLSELNDLALQFVINVRTNNVVWACPAKDCSCN